MSTFSDGAALAFDFNAPDGTTASFSPSGSNLAVIATAFVIEFGTPRNIIECRAGGSGGTVIPQEGSDQAFNSGNALLALFQDAPGPSGSTDIYADIEGTPLQSGTGGVVYSGVDQTTPVSLATPNSGADSGVSTTVASVSLTGCTSGRKVGAWFAANSDAVNLTAFTSVDTELQPVLRQNTDHVYTGLAWVEKTATGSNETISVNINASGSATLTWAVFGMQINDAAGAAAVFNPMTGRGGAAAQPLA